MPQTSLQLAYGLADRYPAPAYGQGVEPHGRRVLRRHAVRGGSPRHLAHDHALRAGRIRGAA
ncbi:MAG: hypothetical protein MZW92_63750 [Comamonadaceae bacterium]|nr:hypothetical protein [Comamonadaceae bacterium]